MAGSQTLIPSVEGHSKNRFAPRGQPFNGPRFDHHDATLSSDSDLRWRLLIDQLLQDPITRRPEEVANTGRSLICRSDALVQ